MYYTVSQYTYVSVVLTPNIHVFHFGIFIFVRVKQSPFLDQGKKACGPVIKLTGTLNVMQMLN